MKRSWNTISILGAGNLGLAIANGVTEAEQFTPEQITLSRRQIEFLSDYKERGFSITSDNRKATRSGDIILLAVEPRHLKEVLTEIAPDVEPDRHLILSVVAGVDMTDILNWLGKQVSLIRAAPNTAVSIKESMTCLCSSDGRPDGLEQATMIFESMGEVRVIDEALMPAATALCASGVAFFLRAIQAAAQAGVEAGFSPEEARHMATQTAKGAATLLLDSGRHPEEEIDRVTTPGGCTISGLNRMEESGFSAALIDGIRHATDKAERLS